MEIPINQKKGPESVGVGRKSPLAGGGTTTIGQPAFRRPFAAPMSMAAKSAQPKAEATDTLALKIVDYIVKTSIYLAVFLFPLFFLLNVPSVLELNKQFILVILIGIGFLGWVGKMAWKNEIRFKKNFILVPVITFVAILGISSFTSIYSEQSLWGYFGGESKAFITTLFFAAMFLLIANTIQTRKEAIRLLLVFLASGFLVTLFGILQIYGKFILPIDATKSVYFNTVGSVYIFAVYVAALLLITISLFLDKISKVLKIGLIVLSFFFFFALLLINFKLVWWALIAALALILGAAIVKSKAGENQARILPMVFIVLALLMALRSQPLIKKQMPVEVMLNYKTSAKIALQSFKEHAILGAGPSMFAQVYEKNRPDNLGDFWSVNFNDATSYFFTLMATTGILGTISFLFLVGTGLVYLFKVVSKTVFKEGESDFMVIGAGATWLFLTIMNFLYISNMSIQMIWWLSFALFISFVFFDPSTKAKEFVTSSQSPRSSLTLSFVFVLVIIGFITAIYLQSQKYVAAAAFNQALKADASGEEIDKITEQLGSAIGSDPNRDLYYRNLAVAYFAQANKRVAEKGQDLSADDSAYVSSRIKGAVQMAQQAVALNPKDPDNYITLGGIYEGVLSTMDQADEKAVESYEKAIEADPKNPAIHQKIAAIYVTLSDIEAAKQQQQQKNQQSNALPQTSKEYLAKAKDYLNKALSIKSDYADANLLMASIYEREGNLKMAIEKEKQNKALYPTAPGVAFRLGLLYYKNNQLDEAKAEFNNAITLDKNYSNARYFLGLILDKQKDKSGAIAQFEKIAELNPTNDDVKKILDNLKNGKEALAGLQQDDKQTPIEENNNNSQENQAQPSIKPNVDNQNIPQGATPSPDELQQNNQ